MHQPRWRQSPPSHARLVDIVFSACQSCCRRHPGILSAMRPMIHGRWPGLPYSPADEVATLYRPPCSTRTRSQGTVIFTAREIWAPGEPPSPLSPAELGFPGKVTARFGTLVYRWKFSAGKRVSGRPTQCLNGEKAAGLTRQLLNPEIQGRPRCANPRVDSSRHCLKPQRHRCC